jgi:hypothetical protein
MARIDPPAPAAKPRDLKPDPDRIGISGSVPFVRLPAGRHRDRDRGGRGLDGVLRLRDGGQEAEIGPEGVAAPAAKPRDLKPDPDRIGISGSVPFVRLPAPDRLFADRARHQGAGQRRHAVAGPHGEVGRHRDRDRGGRGLDGVLRLR